MARKSATKRKIAPKFYAELLVTIEAPGTDQQYYNCHKTIEGTLETPGETKLVGRYKLVETLEVTTQVVTKVKRRS